MLVQLTALQVQDWWPVFEEHIAATLPVSNTAIVSNVKAALLSGEMHMWIIFDEQGNERIPYGFVLTTFTFDSCAGLRNLLLYCIYGYKQIPTDLWFAGWETLKAFARGSSCQRIVAFSNVPRVIEIAQQLGLRAESTLLSIEV